MHTAIVAHALFVLAPGTLWMAQTGSAVVDFLAGIGRRA